MGLNVYPSEDFDFVDSVQLPDLILDLFCIHREIHLLWCVWLQYTGRFPFINTLLGGYRGFLRRAGSFATELWYTRLCRSRSVGTTILVSPCMEKTTRIIRLKENAPESRNHYLYY